MALEAAPVASASAPAAPAGVGSITVRTDVLDLEIALAGGELRRADLLSYPLVKGEAAPVRLFNRDSAEGFFVLQSGLAGPATAARGRPTSRRSPPRSRAMNSPQAATNCACR